MGDINQINDVAAANINQVNDVAKANISEVNDQGVAASGPSRLFIGLADARVGQVPIADVDDVNDWNANVYYARNNDTWDLTDIAVGKDGSGNKMYAAVVNGNNPEIIHVSESDFLAQNQWTEVNVTQKQRTILWGNDVWVTAGMLTSQSANQHIYRSTNGSTWSEVDISGLTGVSSNYAAGIYALTSTGSGTWYFALKGHIYKSTDNASSWSHEHTVSVGGGAIWDLAITNNTLVCLYQSGGPKTISAALSDTTDWSNAVDVRGTDNLALGSTAKRMAAGNGRVVVIDTSRSVAFNVSGKTNPSPQTDREQLPDEGNLNCICTDGAGTFWTGSDGGSTGDDGGDICRSNDNGASWTRTVHGIQDSNTRKIEGIGVDLYLPL